MLLYGALMSALSDTCRFPRRLQATALQCKVAVNRSVGYLRLDKRGLGLLRRVACRKRVGVGDVVLVESVIGGRFLDRIDRVLLGCVGIGPYRLR